MVNRSTIYRLSALSDTPNGEIARSELDLSKFLLSGLLFGLTESFPRCF